jgi:hypothetical protein
MPRKIYSPPQALLDESNRRYPAWEKVALLIVSSAWVVLGSFLVFFWAKELFPYVYLNLAFSVKILR